MKYDAIHFQHETVVYVPCYQKNPTNEKDGYPTFEYRLSEASSDQQLVASGMPDYILVLTGTFDAKTQPFDTDILKHNGRI